VYVIILLSAGILSGLFWLLGLTQCRADWGSVWLNSLDGLNRLFCRYYHGLKHNHAGFDDPGPAIVVANHISGLDPLLMIAACHRPLRFMIARDQYERFGLQWLFRRIGCIPVDRDSRPQQAFREAIRALKRGDVVALFAQGGFQVDAEQFGKLKGGSVRLARLTQAPIYPMHIQGIHPWSRGSVILAVLIPSRVQMHCYAAMRCTDGDDNRCLQQIKGKILPDFTGGPGYPT